MVNFQKDPQPLFQLHQESLRPDHGQSLILSQGRVENGFHSKEAIFPRLEPEGHVAAKGPLCQKAMSGLRELAVGMDASFFPELLAIFENDAAKHLTALHSAMIGDEGDRFRREAHTLKGACLTIGAKEMASICQRLEDVTGVPTKSDCQPDLTALDLEFDRVKVSLTEEALIP